MTSDQKPPQVQVLGGQDRRQAGHLSVCSQWRAQGHLMGRAVSSALAVGAPFLIAPPDACFLSPELCLVGKENLSSLLVPKATFSFLRG